MSSYDGFPRSEGLLQPFGYGLGYQDFVAIATPAAGANASFTVEGRNLVRIYGARATLTTSATVANRFLSLDYLTARGNTFLRNAAGLVVVASTTNQAFEWNAQRTDDKVVANAPVLLPVFPAFLTPGTVVQFTVDAIQVGDQLTSLSLYVERFDTGSIGYERGYVSGEQVVA
jgi:hypothetical protein